MLENFETTSSTAGEEHLEGMIHVSPVPPPNLENPDCPIEVLRIDLATIDADPDPRLKGMHGWQRITDCLLHWDNADWVIDGVQPIESGETCLLIIRRISNETP